MKKIEKQHIVSAIGIAGIAFAAFNFNGTPLFNSLDAFVLFGADGVVIEQEVQVSSGNIGSNQKLEIEKDAIINGNLFADMISIDKNTTIHGSASFNKLTLHQESQILGTQTKPVQLPIANFSDVPEFIIGTEDHIFTGTANILPPANYRNIVIEKNSRLTLTGGMYNLRTLELKDGAVLIFDASTAINIQFKLEGKDRTAILPGQNVKPDDLVINYLGIKPKQQKEEKEDDDDEINSLLDDQEKKDRKDGKIGRPIVFGKQSFLNFKLLAPKANVRIGQESTMRGQILARKIKTGKGGIVSREEAFEKESDSAKVVEDRGVRFVVNEIVVLLTDNATFIDVQAVAGLVNGKIDGFVPNPPTYKLLVSADTPIQLYALITQIKNAGNPLLIEAVPNIISESF